MLMTKFEYSIKASDLGGSIAVRRQSDNMEKTFYLINLKTKEHIDAVSGFMDSITDELADGYFPKPRKK